MNQIPVKQNESKQLERLAAQRELYSSAKRYQFWQLILNIAIPVLLALLSIKLEYFAPFAALYGLIITVLDMTIIELVVKNKREKAAKIQELFDCDVLELKSSPLKTVDDVTVEEVLIHYDAHKKIPTNIEKIRDWYPTIVRDLPISIARIICQRSNCWWDSRLRNRYSNLVRNVGIGTIIVIVIAAVSSDLSFINVVLIGSALSPFFQYCMKQYNDQRDAAKRLTELVAYSKNIWDNAFDADERDLAECSRRLQDEIFEHRSKSPLILDIFYNRLRDKDEEIMNRTANSLVEEALNRTS